MGRIRLLVVALAAVLIVVGVAVIMTTGDVEAEQPETVAASPGPATEPEVEVEEAEGEPAGDPPATSFTVAVTDIGIVNTDEAEIRGHDRTPVDAEAAARAVKAARAVLDDYLTAQFLDDGTRFGNVALRDLLTGRAHAALTDADRRGLGALPVEADATAPGDATATAQVVIGGAEARLVTLSYTAKVAVIVDGTAYPGRQHGAVTFMLTTGQGWRADAADVRLDLHDAVTGGGDPT
jgi:hypothetical protein